MSEERPLPAGWYSNVDPATGNTYYYNDKNETTWTFPEEPATNPAVEQEEAKAAPDVTPSQEEPTVDGDSNSKEGDNTPPETQAEKVGKALAYNYFKIPLFPFNGGFEAIVYLVIAVVLVLVKIIVGFATLKTNSIRRTLDGKSNVENNFLQVYLIVDGFVTLVDYACRFFLLLAPGKAILNAPSKMAPIQKFQTMPLANSDLLFPSNSTHKTLYLMRVLELTLVTLFRIVWSVIAMIFVSNDLMYKNTDKGTKVYHALHFFCGLFCILFFCKATAIVCYGAAFFIIKEIPSKF